MSLTESDRLRSVTVLAVLLTASLTGCGGGSSDELVLVTGVVTNASGPVPDVGITFEPSEGRGSFAKSRDDGTFEMMYKVGKPGVIPGAHSVRVTPPNASRSEEGAMDEENPSVTKANVDGSEAAMVRQILVLPQPFVATAGEAPPPLEINLTELGF